MRLHGRVTDDELGGDLVVREAARDEAEYLELARCQLRECRRTLGGPWTPRELLDESARDRRRQQRFTGRDHVNRPYELVGRRVLEQEAARTGPDRLATATATGDAADAAFFLFALGFLLLIGGSLTAGVSMIRKGVQRPVGALLLVAAAVLAPIAALALLAAVAAGALRRRRREAVLDAR